MLIYWFHACIVQSSPCRWSALSPWKSGMKLDGILLGGDSYVVLTLIHSMWQGPVHPQWWGSFVCNEGGNHTKAVVYSVWVPRRPVWSIIPMSRTYTDRLILCYKIAMNNFLFTQSPCRQFAFLLQWSWCHVSTTAIEFLQFIRPPVVQSWALGRNSKQM